MLSISAVVVSLAASAAIPDYLQATRMTVVPVDKGAGHFCAEHRRWTSVSAEGLGAVQPGDIVKLDRKDGQLPRLTVLRRASDEIGSPEL